MMKTRARAIKNVSHDNENINTSLHSPAKDRIAIRGYNIKGSRKNRNSMRMEQNLLSTRENTISPPDPVMNGHFQGSGTDEQNERMKLIAKALSEYSGKPEDLFVVDVWKQLIKKAVEGNNLMERRYRLDERLMQHAVVIIEQITSAAYRQNVYQILASAPGRARNSKTEKAQQFLNLCDEYELRKSNSTWRNAIGESGNTDDPMDLDGNTSGNSSKEHSFNGWVTDDEESYQGPVLTTDELLKLNDSREVEDEDTDVEKENNLKKTKRITRKGEYHSPLVSNPTSNHRTSPLLRDFKDRDTGSPRNYLKRQCKVSLVCDDRLTEELNLSRTHVLERLTLYEQRDCEGTGPIFSVDEYIENETPPSTPLDGRPTEEPTSGQNPTKRKKHNSSKEKDINCDPVRDDTILKVTPIRGYQSVGKIGMIEQYDGKFDYLALIDESAHKNENGIDDDNDSQEAIPNPPEQKDNKENFPKSEQDIASYYPRPPSGPELKPYMFDAMQEALSKPRKDKIVSAFQLTIKQEHLAVYNKSEWLEDVNIDFYLEMIKDRNNRANSGFPSVYIFHSFFYKLLEKKGYEAVRGGTGAEDIFKFDLVLIPIHSHHHWVLVAVNFRDKSMICYDSMDHNNSNQLDVVGKFLIQEYSENQRVKAKVTNESGNESNEGDYEFTMSADGSGELGSEWKIADKGAGMIPQQTNGRDCGIFCLQFAEYLSRRRDFDFEQKHTAYFRKRMLYETLTKTLLIQ